MNYLKLFLFIFVFVSNNVYGSELKLQTLKKENSVCNDGNNANYWIADQGADKWLIHLPGGGGAWDEKTFIKRDKNKKQSVNKKIIIQKVFHHCLHLEPCYLRKGITYYMFIIVPVIFMQEIISIK